MLNTGYRIAVAMVGSIMIVAGLIMLVLPGPGWAAIFVGLAILSTEFVWARRVMHRARQSFERAKERALKRRARQGQSSNGPAEPPAGRQPTDAPEPEAADDGGARRPP